MYNIILNNDIIRRHNDIDISTFENILNFIIDNTSNIVSPNSIANTLNSYGKKVSYNTVEKYIRYIKEIKGTVIIIVKNSSFFCNINHCFKNIYLRPFYSRPLYSN